MKWNASSLPILDSLQSTKRSFFQSFQVNLKKFERLNVCQRLESKNIYEFSNNLPSKVKFNLYFLPFTYFYLSSWNVNLVEIVFQGKDLHNQYLLHVIIFLNSFNVYVVSFLVVFKVMQWLNYFSPLRLSGMNKHRN